MKYDYQKIASSLLNDMNYDYIPLHDILREFSGFDEPPTDEHFHIMIEFLLKFTTENNILIYKGPDMVLTQMNISDLLNHLKTKWLANQYEEINYAFWFDKIDNGQDSA